ncbi:MAG: Flp pilus assembly protein CpaB [Candidatus Omnitrophica bacterium]|nr:Flp pilus assembly protein CpaB [Candidatus Omnitrophota bacterium]
MPRRVALILGIVLGLIATFLVKVYLDQQTTLIKEQAKKELLKKQQMQAEVVVAKEDIPKGTTLQESMLEIKIVPRDYLQPRSVSSVERILGMVTAVPISKGEQITTTKLLSPQQVSATTGGSLAMATPIGKRAVTIPVDNISSLAGMIRPGDYVDVIGMVPVPTMTPDGKQVTQGVIVPLFQNVLVLAVGRQLSAVTPSEDRYEKDKKTAEPSSLVTLALSPQEANLIAFVQEQGKIRLILRSPADSKIEPIIPASWDTLFQYIMPQIPQGQVSETQAPAGVEKPKEVEVYRGLKRETMLLSK